MNISLEEKLMYRVMKALYDSGIPISFKGSMVLKACLMDAGFWKKRGTRLILTRTGTQIHLLLQNKWLNLCRMP